MAGDLETPVRTLAANWARVSREGPHFRMIFGHLLPGESRLSAALHLSIPFENFSKSLDSPKFMEALAQYANDNKFADFAPADAQMPPHERNAFERASVVFLAQTGHDAEARFFLQSPGENFNMQKFAEQGRAVTLQQIQDLFKPIVTVYTDTSILWYICRTSTELR